MACTAPVPEGGSLIVPVRMRSPDAPPSIVTVLRPGPTPATMLFARVKVPEAVETRDVPGPRAIEPVPRGPAVGLPAGPVVLAPTTTIVPGPVIVVPPE